MCVHFEQLTVQKVEKTSEKSVKKKTKRGREAEQRGNKLDFHRKERKGEQISCNL